MTYTITIDMDSRAARHAGYHEVARILRQLAYQCESREAVPEAIILSDLGNNVVGRAEVTP